jgi:2-polyprenyl-3-methyl-5-hydroxy-6-metoxy-1,4-benzoquinol methylase
VADHCRACGELFEARSFTLSNLPSVAQYFPTDFQEARHLVTDLNLFECLNCGLVQLSNSPVYYFKEVIRSTNVSSEMRKFRIEQLTDFFETFSLWKKRFIEVGCGDGDFLEILSEMNLSCAGIEFSSSSASRLHESGFNVYNFSPLDVDEWPNSPYEVFFTFNVLEHMPKPVYFMTQIAKNMTPDGIGIVEVPNFDFIKDNNILSEFMLEHLTYFTKDSLSFALISAGFEILERTPLNFNHFSDIWNDFRDTIGKELSKFKPKSLCVWGAGHQSLASISILNLNAFVKYIVDSSPKKQGKKAPGSGLDINSPSIINNDYDIDGVIVMGGSYSEEICKTLQTNFRSNIVIFVLKGHELVRVQ